MVTWISVAALLWPLALAAAVVDRLDHDTSAASAVVYLAASRVCHQQAERSFQTQGQVWPVCGRCAGLYLGGAIGILLTRRRRGPVTPRRMLRGLAAAAVPTALTWGGEFGAGLAVSSLTRAVAAVPLGAAVTLVLVGLAGRSKRIG